MANFSCRTNPKYSSDPHGKPRVYFTCHPEDFDKYFDKICEDIFKTQDCAIYYTEDMTEVISDEDMDTDMGRMNLFVVPVTLKLLLDPNRAMDSDLAYAKQEKLAILPFMMESGIDIVYERPDKFGERQYLSPSSSDLTEISYEEKLKKHLESVLISKETADKVRAAFDAYIFLSYRKKDRKYANELMRLIHKDPKYRDIAIWYDEFLTPGESFKANIEKALSQSKLFALLVTPNLLEEPGGNPNYIMEHEYPDAKKAGMDILPTEMEETDKEELGKKFDGIPECVDPSDDPTFKERLAESLVNIAIGENDDNPEHNFLIGLAYLDGIDVEVDRERGIALITSAAEAGLLEAMNKLYYMYNEGTYVDLDYREAVKWGEKLTDHAIKHFGEEDPRTLASLNNLSVTYHALGYYQLSLELNEKIYDLKCRVLGEKDPDMLRAMNALAVTYKNKCDSQKAMELLEKAYHLQFEVLGEEHPDTIDSLSKLGIIYFDTVSPQKGLDMLEKAYALHCKTLGEEHPNTLMSLNNLAGALEDCKKALELQQKAYTLMQKTLNTEHPYTLCIMHDLAYTYGNLGEFENEYKLYEEVYTLRCKVLGKEHPQTLCTLKNIAMIYFRFRNYKKAAELLIEVYIGQRKAWGENHQATIETKEDLFYTLIMLRNESN